MCRAFLPELPPLDPETLRQGTYWALGSQAVLFVLTFAVAPRYKTELKGDEPSWLEMYAQLEAMGGVESVTPTQAIERVRRGCASAQPACYCCLSAASGCQVRQHSPVTTH